MLLQAEFLYKAKPKAARQFEAIERDSIPFAVIIGSTELSEGKVRVKQQQVGKDSAGSAEDKDGQLIDRAEMVEYIKSRLAQK